MTRREVTLREFKYFDRQIVDDFLSIIEGGLATESKSSSVKKDRKIGAEVNVVIGKIKRDSASQDVSSEETKTLGDAALFQRLYNSLTQLGKISKSFDSTLGQGDIIEFNGAIELPFFETAINFLKQCSPLIKPENLDANGISIVNMLTQSPTLNVRVIATQRTKIRLVAILQKRNLRVPQQELADNYSGLFRVKKVLKKGEIFDVFKLPIKLSQNIIDDLVKNFNSLPLTAQGVFSKKPTQEDLQVPFPALILTPIAIYQ